MSAPVFADTFYRIAVSDPVDSARAHASLFDRPPDCQPMVTIEEVLTPSYSPLVAWEGKGGRPVQPPGPGRRNVGRPGARSGAVWGGSTSGSSSAAKRAFPALTVLTRVSP